MGESLRFYFKGLLRALILTLFGLSVFGVSFATNISKDNEQLIDEIKSKPLGLFDAWVLTKSFDPSYQSAIQERQASSQERAMGAAPLLPQVSASYGRTKHKGTLESPNFFGKMDSEDLDYTSWSKQIQAEQSVFDWSRIANFQQSGSKVELGKRVFDTKSRDIELRLVSRFMQVILSNENVLTVSKNKESNEKFVHIAQRRYESGEGTKTDVYEAKSRLDLSKADLIEAQNSLHIALKELDEMIGYRPTKILSLSNSFKLKPLSPESLEDWIAMSLSSNFDIGSSLLELEIANKEISKNFGEHLPSVSLSASRSINQSESVTTRDQKNYITSKGVRVNVPIFSGGMTHAKVKQSQHYRNKAGFDLEATKKQVQVDVTRSYQGVVSGAQRIKALETAKETSQSTLVAMQVSYEGGIRSISDILDAQEQLFIVELELNQARLQYINSHIELRALVSQLQDSYMQEVTSTWFTDVIELSH